AYPTTNPTLPSSEDAGRRDSEQPHPISRTGEISQGLKGQPLKQRNRGLACAVASGRRDDRPPAISTRPQSQLDAFANPFVLGPKHLGHISAPRRRLLRFSAG